MSELDSLKAELEALRAANTKLRAQQTSRPSKAAEFTAREDNCDGSPGLTFEGPFRKPFFIGVNKLRTIQACWHRVERFLQNQPQARNPAQRTEEPDQI